MRKHRLRTALRALALAGCAFAGGAAGTLLVDAGSAAANPASSSPYALLRQLARVLVLVEQEYVEPVDRNDLLQGALSGMVAELDPHSAYLTPEDYSLFRADTQGEFGGIGVEVDFRDDAVTVIAPIEGSPAARAGVRSGDKIVSIDKVPVRGKSARDLVQRMRGKPGTKVTVGIQRAGRDKLLYFELEREIIQVASVVAKPLKDDIGYLRIKQFQAGTHDELLQALGQLRGADGFSLRGLVLDLRNNPGGLVDEAAAVADEFLRGGVIYTTRARERTIDEVRANQTGAMRRGPMAVLVNEYSASAAELVAGALQDHDRASVVGARTFGKGSVQSIISLPEGAGLRLTTMLYYTPSGRTIQAQGIEPDVLVEAAYVADRSYGVVRESDLEGHIETQQQPAPSGEPEISVDAGAAEEGTHLGVARDVPDDPAGGKDFALSIGYQIVRSALKR